MIIYFVNRNLAVLGLASTNLSAGYEIVDDELVESVDTGVSSLSATIAWTDETRLQLEEWAYAGNYILTENNNQAEMFTIITSETDTAEKTVTIYAENAGLDLINEIAPSYTADAPHNIEWYITEFLGDSEFKIGTNELPDTELTLSWDNTSTVTERIRSIATAFGNAEISYSFDVENLHITGKYINIWQKRGTDAGQELRLDRDINSFRVITSAEDLFTGLVVTGGTPEGSDSPITLAGYAYDDGDIFVSNGNLYSREGADRFGRMATGISYIMGTFNYDTVSQEELCSRAVEYLNQHKEPAVNYDIDIERGLDETRIGDRINLVDDKGEIYVSARILELKTSVTQNYKQATLGEYLIKSSGISDKVLELAGQFAQIANDRDFLYAVSVSSSAGSYFVDTAVETTLKASVLYGGAQINQPSNVVVKWYSGTTLLGTGMTYNVVNADTISIICRLERGDAVLAEDYITLFSLKMVYETAEDALTKAGDAVVSDTLHYLATDLDSGVTIQTAGWTTTPQQMTAVKKYLWTYHTYVKANGTSLNTAPIITGRYGEDGVSVTAIQPEYYLSTSPSTLAGGSWSETLSFVTGKYIWTRDKVTYSNSTTSYSTAIYNSALTVACENALSAFRIASDTDQHFWFTETGTDTGAHITQIPKDDFLANPQSGGANLLLRSNGIAIRNGLAELASFSANGVITGRAIDGQSRTEISSSGLQILQRVGTNDVVIATLGYGSGNTSTAGTQANAPYYTLGNRTGTIGNWSMAEGVEVIASGYASHAEGASFGDGSNKTYTTASGNASHAEGYGTRASGVSAHSEGVLSKAIGYASHAEGGSTQAQGQEAHAEGFQTIAHGDFSHAGGSGTVANGEAQTVIGKWNVADTTSLLIIGNGTADNARSNALTVAQDGTIAVHGAKVPTRNVMCYANSRVDNFVNGQITLSLSSLGITTGAKPVGILLTYQDGGSTPTILRYDYDASSASGVIIKAYNSSGGAVSGNVRYFAMVFQNSWTGVS